MKKSKRGRLIEGTSASAQQEDLEVDLTPPSSAYWRNEFQGASSGQGYPQGWTNQWEENKDQAWGHVRRRPHHLATTATHPRHIKERCPTRHFQHVCNLFSFVFITMINKCITYALMLWLVMMIESLRHVKYDDRCRFVYFLVLGLCMIKLMLSLI